MVLYRLFSTVDETLWKKSIHFTSFSEEIFSIYFEHNRNSIEIKIHVLKNIKSFSSLEHCPKMLKCLSIFKVMFPLVLKVLKNFL